MDIWLISSVKPPRSSILFLWVYFVLGMVIIVNLFKLSYFYLNQVLYIFFLRSYHFLSDFSMYLVRLFIVFNISLPFGTSPFISNNTYLYLLFYFGYSCLSWLLYSEFQGITFCFYVLLSFFVLGWAIFQFFVCSFILFKHSLLAQLCPRIY